MLLVIQDCLACGVFIQTFQRSEHLKDVQARLARCILLRCFILFYYSFLLWCNLSSFILQPSSRPQSNCTRAQNYAKFSRSFSHSATIWIVDSGETLLASRSSVSIKSVTPSRVSTARWRCYTTWWESLKDRWAICLFHAKGPFKCYVMLFICKFDTQPPPRNATNVEPWTFVTLIWADPYTPHPLLRYVTREWPLTFLGSKWSLLIRGFSFPHQNEARLFPQL